MILLMHFDQMRRPHIHFVSDFHALFFYYIIHLIQRHFPHLFYRRLWGEHLFHGVQIKLLHGLFDGIQHVDFSEKQLKFITTNGRIIMVSIEKVEVQLICVR